MTPSPTHTAAVLAAIRLPAITARHAVLEAGSGAITLDCYADPVAVDGAALAGPLLASIIQADPTTLDTDGLRIVFSPGIEGLIVAPGVVTWARIRNRAGEWWADATVTDSEGDGDIKLSATSLGVGAFVRLSSGVVQG